MKNLELLKNLQGEINNNINKTINKKDITNEDIIKCIEIIRNLSIEKLKKCDDIKYKNIYTKELNDIYEVAESYDLDIEKVNLKIEDILEEVLEMDYSEYNNDIFEIIKRHIFD